MKRLQLFFHLLFPLLLLLASPALARIGETPSECAARYGKAVSVDEEHQATLHEKAGIEVTCFFHDGKCDYIAFSNLEKDADRMSVAFTDAERKVLFEASSGSGVWTRIGGKNGLNVWECRDLTGLHRIRGDCHVIIYTRAHTERARAKEAKEKEDQERANLKDF